MQDEKQKNEETISEDLQKSFDFVPGAHRYRQQGYYLVCKDCDLTHAVFIGKELVMVGQDENGPILKKRKELFA